MRLIKKREKRQNIGLEEKITWNGTIEDIVDNETIMITIDTNFNSREFTAQDFKVVDIVEDSFDWLTKKAYEEYMVAGTFPKGFRHIIIFKIVDKGAQNLMDAIRLIEKISFVYSVSPNSFDSLDDEPQPDDESPNAFSEKKSEEGRQND